MGVQLGDIAPDFTVQSTEGEISLHQYLGRDWGLLLSHHKDFTPVATTELTALAKLQETMHALNVKVLSVSVDEVVEHFAFKKEIEARESVAIGYPLLSDACKEVANLYDMIHPQLIDTLPLRDTFIISPDKRVQLRLTYPVAVGRNFHEIVRVIQALQVTYANKVGTPANWTQGDDCVVQPSLSDMEAQTLFPKGVTAVNAYLRFTPEPS